MCVRIITKTDLSQRTEPIESLGEIECLIPLASAESKCIQLAEDGARLTLLERAGEMGADFIVLEPHIQLAPIGKWGFYIQSASAYKCANEM